MKPPLLPKDTIQDIVPFFTGHTIHFRYSDGKCTRITGKDQDDLVMSIEFHYKDGVLSRIDIESADVKLPHNYVPESDRTIPGIGQIEYHNDQSRVRAVDGSLSLYTMDREYESLLHREYRYDNSGHILQVIQNGDIVQESTYRDDMLIQVKYPSHEKSYVYNDSRLLSGIILKEDNMISNWRAFEYTENNKVAREFVIRPGGQWQLRALHFHDFSFDDVEDLTVHDSVSRHYYDKHGRLLMKLRIDDDEVREKGFKPFRSSTELRNQPNLNGKDLELFMFDPKERSGFVYRKQNGKSIVCQFLQYNKNGFLKAIETVSGSFFHGVCLLSLRHLTCNDLCF
jgi:hypothetical protein